MRNLRLAALLGSALLTPCLAFADNQCVSTPSADTVPSPAPASAPAPVSSPAPAQSARIPAASPLPSPVAQPNPAPSSSAADSVKASGIHELSSDEVARIPGLASVVKAGARVFLMGHGAGVPNLLAVSGEHFQAFAPMSDPHYLCRGMIQDADGNSVTLAEASKIPGLVPPPGQSQIEPLSTPAEALQAIAKAGHGTFGPASAPTVWAVIDPLCVHSQQSIHDLLPYAQAGKIRLNIMPVSVIDPRSVPAARVLLSQAPDQMLNRWLQPGILQANYDVASGDKLDQNNRVFAGIAAGMQVTGVPEFLWTTRGVTLAKAGLDTAEVQSFVAGLGS